MAEDALIDRFVQISIIVHILPSPEKQADTCGNIQSLLHLIMNISVYRRQANAHIAGASLIVLQVSSLIFITRGTSDLWMEGISMAFFAICYPR